MGGWPLALVVPDAVCLAMCGTAAVTDLRAYRIPNWLTASGAVAGLMANAGIVALTPATASTVLLLSIVGGLTLLLVSGALGAAGLMGMGDVKLLAAAGLCVRWPGALALLLYTSLAGGVLAIAVAIRRKRLGQVARNLSQPAAMRAAQTPHRMPYGVAIFAGAAWTVAARFAPGISLL